MGKFFGWKFCLYKTLCLLQVREPVVRQVKGADFKERTSLTVPTPMHTWHIIEFSAAHSTFMDLEGIRSILISWEFRFPNSARWFFPLWWGRF